jgi:hypothetical protein
MHNGCMHALHCTSDSALHPGRCAAHHSSCWALKLWHRHRQAAQHVNVPASDSTCTESFITCIGIHKLHRMLLLCTCTSHHKIYNGRRQQPSGRQLIWLGIASHVVHLPRPFNAFMACKTCTCSCLCACSRSCTATMSMSIPSMCKLFSRLPHWTLPV